MLLNTKWESGQAEYLLALLERWGGDAPAQRSFLELVRARLGVRPAADVSIDSLGPARRREVLEFLLVMTCLGSEATDAQLSALELLNRQLTPRTPWPGIVRHAKAGRGKRATMTMAGLSPDGKALLRVVWKKEGVFGVVRALLSSLGRGPSNPTLAARYEQLGALPPNTLGHAFFTHMRSRKLPMPGEKGSLPEVAMHHDLMHVLTGFDTDARGEGRLAGFYAGATSRHPIAGADAFAFVMVGLMTFHLGYDIGPTFVGAEHGVVDPSELLRFIELGSRVPFNVLTDWSFAEDLPRPLREVRSRFGIHPDGALAMS
ncbi:MAG: hypothetical protein Q8K32_24455 [Archangium sp.]|nr:hypothetical protein [Archangium sp.]